MFSSILAYSRSKFWGGRGGLFFLTGALDLVVVPGMIFGGGGAVWVGNIGGGGAGRDWGTLARGLGTNKFANGFRIGAGLLSWGCEWVACTGK